MMWVKPEGPITAKLAVVGEAPGHVELQTGKPFSGPAGDQLNDVLRQAGLKRGDVYITNVIKDSAATPTDDDIQRALPELVKELTQLPNCNIFIAVGGVALRALSAWKYSSITRMRGSILETFFGAKMLPTLHMAWYMRGEWRYKPVVVADVKRAVLESSFPELRRPARHFLIEPTFDEALLALHKLKQADELAVDIETFGSFINSFIACVGFADTVNHAVCIPIMRAGRVPYWTHEQECMIWRELDEVLRSPSRKYFQNGMFDIGKFHANGLGVENFYFDTMLAHHLLVPELPHDLGFITSIYSQEPYYKDEGKTWDHRMNTRQLWAYNLKDCVVTLEAGKVLEKDLAEEGMLDYFHSFVMKLPKPLLAMQEQGIKVDIKSLARTNLELTCATELDQLELETLLKRSFNVKSPTDCQWLLETFGIKPTRFTKTGRSKLDEESLRIYAARRPCREFDLIFSVREKRTLSSGFLGLRADEKGYYHPGYLVHGTKSGRLSSRGTGEGPQIQNIPEEARRIFVPRAGCEFVGADLSQAEARVVAWLAQDQLMMEFFRSGKDIHRFYAAIIFNKPPDLVSKHPERYVAKRIEHGSNYKMGPRKLVSVLRNEGIIVAESDAIRYQREYFKTFPGIQRWQNEVEQVVRRFRSLTTCFGRKRVFLGIFDDDLVREAISYEPQGTVGELTNRALLTLQDSLPVGCRLVLQVHDSVLIESPVEFRSQVIRALEVAFDIPLTIKGEILRIPIEVSAGPSWGDLKEIQ